MAALLYRWLRPPLADQAQRSRTSPAPRTPPAINALAEVGVVQGREDRTFQPRTTCAATRPRRSCSGRSQYLDSLDPDPEPGPHPWDEVGRDALRQLDLEATDADGNPLHDVQGVDYHGTIVHPRPRGPSPTPARRSTSTAGPPRSTRSATRTATRWSPAGSFGLRIYDVRDRFEPKLIGELSRTELALPGDEAFIGTTRPATTTRPSR